MGQTLSLQDEVQHITVFTGSQQVSFPMPTHPITPRWLLSKVVYLSNNPDIIGLRTQDGLELIDSILSIPDKIIPPQIHIVTLQAIFKQSISDSLSLDSFLPVKIIGNGGFCVVYMVLNKSDGRLYAMKVMKKSLIQQKNKTRQVLSELRIMEGLDHPFIVHLHSAFQTVCKT